MEIVSISYNQNVNSVKVQCRQYLYQNGNQCVWNTGGWLVGLVSRATDTRYAYLSGYGTDAIPSVGVANASVSFGNASISVICNGNAPVAAFVRGIYERYGRGTTKATTTIGTVKPIKNITTYGSLHVTGANGQIAALRGGAANGPATAINTATVIKSGIANGLGLGNVASGNYFLVIGNINSYEGVGPTTPTGGSTTNPGNVSYNQNATITEIYLM